MATYYDALNYTFKLFEENPPPASAQLVFVHLLHQNNRLGNTGVIQISDRELGQRTRLSKQTITEAKRTLKNRGLIDFKTDRDKPHKATTYSLPFFTAGQGVGQFSGQGVGQTLGQPGCVCYTRDAHEDLRQEKKVSVGHLSTRERETLRRLGLTEEEGETQTAATAKTAAERQTCGKDANDGIAYTPAYACTLPLKSPGNLDDILEYWERELRGGRLSFEHQSQIAEWLETYGYEWVEESMREASDTNGNTYGLNFKLLRGVVERKANPPQKPKSRAPKGGEKSERNGRFDGKIDYGEEPDYSWIKRPK